jgi:hypothetical protein
MTQIEEFEVFTNTSSLKVAQLANEPTTVASSPVIRQGGNAEVKGMHNKILHSSESAYEERRTLHAGRNDNVGSGGNGVDGRIPDYVANIKKCPNKKVRSICIYCKKRVLWSNGCKNA